MVFVFLSLTYFPKFGHLWVHLCCCKWHNVFFFICMSCSPLYIYSTFSWWNDIKLYILLIGWYNSTWPNCWLTWFFMFQMVFFLMFFFSYIRVYLINNIMLILVIHIDVYVLFQILFPFRLGEHNIEQQHWALCWLSILNVAVCVHQSQPPWLSLMPAFPQEL